jgi:pimeloyl-ACP methyl ester carboxylesterase
MSDRSGTIPSRDGVPIAYETTGPHDLSLVLVHGWSCDRTYWRSQIESVSDDVQVVAIDLAGHGESGLARRVQSMPAFGDDVAVVMEHLDLREVILVGHSMGGDVILETARSARSHVIGLVWVDAYRDLPVIRTSEEIDELMAPFKEDFVDHTRHYVRELFPATADPSLVDWIVADVSSAPASIAVPALEAAFRFANEVPTALRELGLPLVGINPDDGTTHRSSLERFGVQVRLIPGVGHFPQLEAPRAFNDVLRAAVQDMRER